MTASHPHGHNGDGLSPDEQRRLWDHVRALEVLAEQKADIALDEKARKDLAKADGFDTNVLAVILKRRKAGEGETRAADTLIQMYEDGLRDQGVLPLERTQRQPAARRSVEEIADDLHGEPAPVKPGDGLDAAVRNLDDIARSTGGTITMTAGDTSVTFGADEEHF